MQVGSCFVYLVASNPTVKTEFKMYCKYKNVNIKLIKLI
jgi:hypothetical protein